MAFTTLFDIPTPSLVLDRAKLTRNIQRMAKTVNSKGATLRPHMKTAKSIDVARLATEGQAGGIAVSTLKEAEYFASYEIRDIQYAVCVVPDKLARVAAIQQSGARVTLITDSLEVARAICARGRELNQMFFVQAELDSGEGRSGVSPDSEELLEIARTLETATHASFAGVMTHAGHSYGCRTLSELDAVAEEERLAAVHAAKRVRDLKIECPSVSIGSTPTALHARSFEGITEVRPGVYMFGDMFQAQIQSCAYDDIAATVLSVVSSHHPAKNHFLVDAGALALSKDRSTESVANDIGFGSLCDVRGRLLSSPLRIAKVYQEHGKVPVADNISLESIPIGTRFRVYPNHACMTAAMYDRYYIVDSDNGDGLEVIDIWPRINGW